MQKRPSISLGAEHWRYGPRVWHQTDNIVVRSSPAPVGSFAMPNHPPRVRRASLFPALLLVLGSFQPSCGGSSAGPPRIYPPHGYVLPGGTVNFEVRGSNEAHAWFVKYDRSVGASVDTTGGYQAGSNPNANDVVEASLPSGESLTASVLVTLTPQDPLILDDDYLDVVTGASHRFTVTGGSGGYVWTMPSSVSGGHVEVDGTYHAGPMTGVDVLQVADSAGQATQATVTVVQDARRTPGPTCFSCGGPAGVLSLDSLLLLWLVLRRPLRRP